MSSQKTRHQKLNSYWVIKSIGAKICPPAAPYILRREDPPECTACQEIYSIRDVLIDCIDLGLIWPRFYSVPDMKSLFDTVSVDRIISYVEINLFSKI